MNFARVADIIQICLPVFALIAAGKLLQRRGALSREILPALNSLLYYLALPALVFSAAVVQPFHKLLSPVPILGTIGPALLVAFFFLGFTRLIGYRGDQAAACTFGTYWGNIAYVGFPLARSAFGAQQGLSEAAIVNAFAMPVLTYLSMFFIGMLRPAGQGSLRGAMKTALLNPVIIAGLSAVLIAFVRDYSGVLTLQNWFSRSLGWTGTTVLSFFSLLGAMGLPLALISVGSSVSIGRLHEHRWPLALAAIGKLVILPLVALLFIDMVFPGADKSSRGVAVLLMAMPNAVSSYVISTRMGVAPQLVGSMVAVSTALSVVTVPVWLYFLL